MQLANEPWMYNTQSTARTSRYITHTTRPESTPPPVERGRRERTSLTPAPLENELSYSHSASSDLPLKGVHHGLNIATPTRHGKPYHGRTQDGMVCAPDTSVCVALGVCD